MLAQVSAIAATILIMLCSTLRRVYLAIPINIPGRGSYSFFRLALPDACKGHVKILYLRPNE
jgi:hypothetical protein